MFNILGKLVLVRLRKASMLCSTLEAPIFAGSHLLNVSSLLPAIFIPSIGRAYLVFTPKLVTFDQHGSNIDFFGRGSISGCFFSQDRVRVGDIAVKHQIFVEITKEGNLAHQFDGMLGLGFKDITVGQATPVWYNMIKQGRLSQPLFSLWLNKESMSKLRGEIVFGGVDWRQFRGDHTYVQITKKGYWQVED